MSSELDNFYRVLPQVTGGGSVYRYLGNPRSGVCIVGLGPEHGEDEASPFSGAVNRGVRTLLSYLHIPQRLVYLTYFRKRYDGYCDDWGVHFWQEMRVVKPRVIIFLGAEVFNAAMNSGKAIEELRKRQWGHAAWSEVSFFATYSPQDVFADGGVHGDAWQQWVLDLQSIVEGQSMYFTQGEILDG